MRNQEPMYTTFNLLKKSGVRGPRYRFLAESLGGITQYGADTPIPLLKILDLSGLEDCLWSLRAGADASYVSEIAPLIAADCAELVLYLFETKYPNDLRPRAAIEAARGNGAEVAARAAEVAARAAAEVAEVEETRAAWAAEVAAREAARAAEAAARAAAVAAREAAAWAWAAAAAARAAAEVADNSSAIKHAQKRILIKYLS